MKSYLWLFILFVACNPHRIQPLEEALILAGDNRLELQKALDYFSENPDDYLKLKACEYLIANMPGHYGYTGTMLTKFRKEIDSLYSGEPFLCQVLQSVYCHNEFLYHTLRCEEDIRIIKGDFLVRHVEKSFDKWKRLPWLRNLSLNEFCDYILPYRVENEQLSDILRLLDTSWLNQEACLLATSNYDDIYHFPHAVAKVLPPAYRSWVPYLPSPLNSEYTMECYERSLLFLYSYRSVGIPCVLDAVPYWGNINGSHYWAMVIDPFFPERFPEEMAFRKIPKVYRMSYRHEEKSVWKNIVKGADFFEGSFWQDVTERYISTESVEIKIPRKFRDCEAIYLCVFNQGDWKPVDGEFLHGGKVHFDKLGYDIVYLPVCYKNDKQLPIGKPFILKRGGTMQELECTDVLMNFTAYRKYPYNHQAEGGGSMVKTLFECANQPDFSDSKVIYEVKDNSLMEVRYVDCPDKAFRYWRIRPNATMSLAELAFIRQGKKVKDFVVSTLESTDVCFDNNPLTYGNYRGVIDFDFGETVKLDSIYYMPLNDGNGIFPGNIYELRYWEGEYWEVFCTKIAEKYSLTFKGVPSGGLYWLRNLTTGTQERIFIVENGKMKFY